MEELTDTWRERLKAVIEEKGRSMREVSLAAGQSPNYLFSILTEGKEPSLFRMAAVADELGITLSYILYGFEMSADSEKLMRAYAGLTDQQKQRFLQLAESMPRKAH